MKTDELAGPRRTPCMRTPDRSVRLAAALALGCWLASGCVYVKDHLTIDADGAGTVELEVMPYVDPDTLPALLWDVSDPQLAHLAYPPLNEQDVKRLFPGGDFTTTVVETEDKDAGQVRVRVKVAFKDVNRLVASPYGRAHALSMVLDPGKNTLTLRAMTGLQTLKGLDGVAEKDLAQSGADWKALNEARQKLHVEFRVTLPQAVQAPGAAVDGKTAAWVVDRASIKDPAKVSQALSTPVTMTCSAEGVKFTPMPVTRPELERFADLPEGPTGEKPASAVAADDVKARVKVVPVMCRITRTFDLSGTGYDHENQAVVQAVVLLPRDLAPMQWGKCELTQATDERGNNLLADNERRYDRFSGFVEDFPADKSKETATHWVSLEMKPPTPDSKVIRQILGTVEVYYPGQTQVVKFKDAVAKEALVTLGSRGEVDTYSSVGGDEDAGLKSPVAQALGLKVQAPHAYVSRGVTTIMLTTETKDALVREVQVYDAQGTAWSTVVSRQGSSDLQVVVAGKPEGPLSIAVVVSVGKPVKLPIELKDLAVTPNEPVKPSGQTAKPAAQ